MLRPERTRDMRLISSQLINCCSWLLLRLQMSRSMQHVEQQLTWSWDESIKALKHRV